MSPDGQREETKLNFNMNVTFISVAEVKIKVSHQYIYIPKFLLSMPRYLD